NKPRMANDPPMAMSERRDDEPEPEDEGRWLLTCVVVVRSNLPYPSQSKMCLVPRTHHCRRPLSLRTNSNVRQRGMSTPIALRLQVQARRLVVRSLPLADHWPFLVYSWARRFIFAIERWRPL